MVDSAGQLMVNESCSRVCAKKSTSAIKQLHEYFVGIVIGIKKTVEGVVGNSTLPMMPKPPPSLSAVQLVLTKYLENLIKASPMAQQSSENTWILGY